MWIRGTEQQSVEWNWVAIISYAGSLVVSLAMWAGILQAIRHLVR